MPSMKPNKRVYRERDFEAEANVWADDERAYAVDRLKASRNSLRKAGSSLGLWSGGTRFEDELAKEQAEQGFSAAKRAQRYKAWAEEARKRKRKKAISDAIRSGKALEVRE